MGGLKMAEFDLLQKTELRIERISLQDAHLGDVAAVVADTLGMRPDEVLVTDYQGDIMTIDVLRRTVDARNIVGKRGELLERLSRVPGAQVTEETDIHSDGMLGWIALDEGEVGEAIECLGRSEKMAEEIQRRVAKRAVVFSTGPEIAGGQVKDTNTPMISRALEAEGYSVTRGVTLKDDELLIAGHLRRAVEDEGYGLVITTGGVGAEGKDRTVEAVLNLDQDAATPYVCRYEIGTGRHVKDGVRIAVGHLSGALIVALPGPNDEVERSLEVLVRGLRTNLQKKPLGEMIAAALREVLREKMKHSLHEHSR